MKILTLFFLPVLMFCQPYVQWPLNDNAATKRVNGTLFDGTLVGATTSAVASTLLGVPAFRLNNGTSGQYIQITLGTIQKYMVGNLWTKYASNPVIASPVQFGQLVRNPAVPDWYFFGSDGTSIYRWESSDLKTWAGKTLVLSAGATYWDQTGVQVASVFQDPLNSNQWVMFYRGATGSTYHVGMATSSDGTTFTKIPTGGNPGLYAQFGTNYDLPAIFLVGTTYYAYLDGAPDHGVTNLYTSTNDLTSFSAYSGNPVFANAAFCAFVWLNNGYYYMLIPHDVTASAAGVPDFFYNHGISLYRSTVPTFDYGTRVYLGDVILPNQTYDVRYLDTPTLPMTDVYKTAYAPEFGDVLTALYTGQTLAPGGLWSESLASTSLSNLASKFSTPEPLSVVTGANGSYSVSFWMQLDEVLANDPIYSIGTAPTSSGPAALLVQRTCASNVCLALYLNGSYVNTTQTLAINTPYHVVVTNVPGSHKVYCNGTLVSTSALGIVSPDTMYWYIGSGPLNAFKGYVADARIYSSVLTLAKVNALYAAGPQ